MTFLRTNCVKHNYYYPLVLLLLVLLIFVYIMKNLDSVLKSRDITLLTKVRLVKAMVLFPGNNHLPCRVRVSEDSGLGSSQLPSRTCGSRRSVWAPVWTRDGSPTRVGPQSPPPCGQAGMVGRILGDPAGFAPEPLSSHLRTANHALWLVY